MKTYCPYNNVKQQYYPNMLVIAGMNDPRVAYFEPAKWVAKLRHTIPSDSEKLLILRVQEGGHGGSIGQYSHLEELAYEYAFLISCLNAPFKPVVGPSSAVAQLYKKIERDEFARNYLKPPTESTAMPNKSNDSHSKDLKDSKDGKDGKAKYRKAQSQLYQWITNLF
jgi:hypothetical protein